MKKLKTNLWGNDVELDIVFDVYAGETIEEGQAMTLGRTIACWDAINAAPDSMDDRSRDVVESRLTPQYLFVPRGGQPGRIAVVCIDSEDPEHGTAVLFENGNFAGFADEDEIC